jgi:hypothetical protein
MQASQNCKTARRSVWTLTLVLPLVISSFAATAHAETAVDRVISSYSAACDALYAESPDLANDPDPEAAKEFTVDPSLIYELPITPEGTTATVVYAGFSCGWFGRTWCGMAGCGSYLIVGEKVFEWNTVSYPPESVGNGSSTLLVAPIKGFSCQDSNGTGGYGVDPCFSVAVWDEADQTFMTTDGAIRLRDDLSR